MKVSELQKLVGKEIAWNDAHCSRGVFLERRGTLLAIKGKNALVDQGGSNDWKWIPSMDGLKAADRSLPPSRTCSSGTESTAPHERS